MNDDSRWFGRVRWCNDDIATKLEEMGIPVTEENISRVRRECEHDKHFTDGMIEAGWDAIENTILDLNLDKQAEPDDE